MLSIQLLKFDVCGMPLAITHHHHRNLILACAARFAHSTSFTGCSWQLALPIKRLQKERLIDFNDAHHMCSMVLGCTSQEAMAPEKGRVLADATSLGCLAHTPTVEVQTSKSTA